MSLKTVFSRNFLIVKRPAVAAGRGQFSGNIRCSLRCAVFTFFFDRPRVRNPFNREVWIQLSSVWNVDLPSLLWSIFLFEKAHKAAVGTAENEYEEAAGRIVPFPPKPAAAPVGGRRSDAINPHKSSSSLALPENIFFLWDSWC